jgi:hypothetical protein
MQEERAHDNDAGLASAGEGWGVQRDLRTGADVCTTTSSGEVRAEGRVQRYTVASLPITVYQSLQENFRKVEGAFTPTTHNITTTMPPPLLG